MMKNSFILHNRYLFFNIIFFLVTALHLVMTINNMAHYTVTISSPNSAINYVSGCRIFVPPLLCLYELEFACANWTAYVMLSKKIRSECTLLLALIPLITSPVFHTLIKHEYSLPTCLFHKMWSHLSSRNFRIKP